jgi:hypothetical protein
VGRRDFRARGAGRRASHAAARPSPSALSRTASRAVLSSCSRTPQRRWPRTGTELAVRHRAALSQVKSGATAWTMQRGVRQ